MAEPDRLAERFEANRGHPRAAAHRMPGSPSEAEDAVQEARLRRHRADAGGVEHPAGGPTTAVARAAPDLLRARRSRREAPMAGVLPAAAERGGAGGDPAADAELADAVGPALLPVLDALAPAGRLAFVLHDPFGVPFDESAAILGRSPEAARQLASRARRREAVDAFLRASRGGGFAALLTVLDADAVVRADATAVQLGAAPAVRGATAVLDAFLGRAVGAQPAIVGGVAGAARAPGGRIRAVLGFAVGGGRVAALDLVADRERLDRPAVEVLPREGR